MSFFLETSKIGKDSIVYNNHKYRESYSVKCGEIAWRCLGKGCKAYIRTNKDKTVIYSSNDSHSGHHPVTTRSLTPTTSTRVISPVSAQPYTTTPASSHSNHHVDYTPFEEEQPEQETSTPIMTPDIQEENLALKKELEEVRAELRIILDHSIESDMRLLQYTEDVFLPPPSITQSLTDHPTNRSLTSTATQTVEDLALQTSYSAEGAGHCQLLPTVRETPANEMLDECKEQLYNENTFLPKMYKACFDQLVERNNVLENKLHSLESTIKESNQLQQEINKYLSQNSGVLRNNKIRQSNPDYMAEICKWKNKYDETKATLNKLKLELIDKTASYNDLLASVNDPTRHWLSDDTLTSYFNVLHEETLRLRDDMLFLAPSVTQALKLQCKNDVNIILSNMSFNTSKWVFFCLNNSVTRSEGDGGTHWSLLLYHVETSCATHYDSMTGVNLEQARTLLDNMGLDDATLTEGPAPQQSAWYECGLHVVTNARLLAGQLCSGVVIPQLPVVQPPIACTGNSQLSLSLITLEKSLNLDKMPQPEKLLSKTGGWSKVVKKKNVRSTYIPYQTVDCHNKFAILQETDSTNVTVNSKMGKRNNTVDMSKKQEKNSTKHKLMIISDSQGRGLPIYLSQINNDKYSIFNRCQPSAPIKPVIDSIINSSDFENLSKNDFVVLIAGTNNITRQSVKNRLHFLRTFREYLGKHVPLFKHTNLIISTIPYRYDLVSDSPENTIIKEANLSIIQLANSHKHLQLLDLWSLERCYHTEHGLHLNKRGKKIISEEIMDIINLVRLKNSPSISPPSNKKDLAKRKPTQDSAEDTGILHQGLVSSIQVVESDMLEAIHTQDNESVGFAHCISGDFNSRKQMSAGVASLFRRKFGKPKRSDCVLENLTLQRSMNGGTIYGLVTKATYNSKPKLEDYNEAFCSLISHFKKNKLNKLICSPMGCVRDKISPEQFSKNIVKFHLTTGASVDIIVQDEGATRSLRSGLKHIDFVALLRTCIAEELSRGKCTALLNIPTSQDGTQLASDGTELSSMTTSDVNNISQRPNTQAEPVTSGTGEEQYEHPSPEELPSSCPLLNRCHV